MLAAMAARILPSRYRDEKKARLLWESAFCVFEGRPSPYLPKPRPRKKDTP